MIRPAMSRARRLSFIARSRKTGSGRAQLSTAIMWISLSGGGKSITEIRVELYSQTCQCAWLNLAVSISLSLT